MNTIFCSPLRYTQGAHATQSLGAEMKVLGLRGHVLIVASASPRKLLENIWRDSLTQTGYAFSIHDFARECTAAEIASIVATARATIANEFVHNEPFPVTANMVADAIMAADAAGR